MLQRFYLPTAYTQKNEGDWPVGNRGSHLVTSTWRRVTFRGDDDSADAHDDARGAVHVCAHDDALSDASPIAVPAGVH